MDSKLVKKDYTEESGDVHGGKSGVLHETKDQLERQKSSGKFIFICYFCQFVLFFSSSRNLFFLFGFFITLLEQCLITEGQETKKMPFKQPVYFSTPICTVNFKYKQNQKIKYTTPSVHNCVLNIDKYMWACRISVTKYQFFACGAKTIVMKLTPQYAIKTDGKQDC